MRVRYQYATIGWCSDLTDPNATSLPVAILFVGSAGDQNFAAVIGTNVVGVDLDPISKRVLADATDVVRRHVDNVFAVGTPESPEELLFSLRASLRSTLHVAEISDAREVDVPVGLNEGMWTVASEKAESVFVRKSVSSGTAVPAKPTSEPDVIQPYQIWALERMRSGRDSRA